MLCGAGATVLAADDATVIGIPDDPLAIALAAGAAACTLYAFSGAQMAVEGIVETADGVAEAASTLIQNAQTPAVTASPNPLPPDDDKNDSNQSAKDAKPKTPKQGGKSGKRKRWKDSEGNIYEWDYQHGDVEKYDKRRKHLGSIDPKTGNQTPPQ